MPMGISPSPEVFQCKLNQALEGLPGTKIVTDVILGEESNKETICDHDLKLRQLFSRCRKNSIKLNSEKLHLRRTGHSLTSEGLCPDPEKLRAIREMPRPKDVKGIQRLIELAKFCAHLSEACEPLRVLMHTDTAWAWSGTQEEARERIKKLICEALTLMVL